MSYILEALKKADQERTLGTVPDIESVHDSAAGTAPRRLSLWFWIMGGFLLVGNGILIATLVLRNADVGTGTVPEGTDRVVSGQTGPATAPVAAQALPTPGPLPRQPAIRPSQPSYIPPAPAPVPEAMVGVTADSPAAVAVPGAVPDVQTTAPEPAGTAPVAQVPAVARPAVTEPADRLPYWDDLPLEFRSEFATPHIEVHVYDTNPQRRFILVDLKKYREGERLESGAVLEKIIPEGVQLSYRGRQFIYRR